MRTVRAPSDHSPGRRGAALLAPDGRLGGWSAAAVRAGAPWLEDAVVLAVAAVATFRAEWRLIVHPLSVQSDAQIHEFWMRKFQDPGLFDDPLTKALLATGYEPPGFRALYWLASHLVDPVLFGELLPVFLQPLSVWLVYRIVREHTDWRPASWTAAALFLVPWDVHRFSGGHPRAFAEPIVIATVFLLIRRWNVAAALVPPVGMLLYPPGGLVALAIVALAALVTRRPYLDRERALCASASGMASALAALVPRLVTHDSETLISASQARQYPEFGPRGQMHFFATSTLQYLRQNYSGFALRESGSILAVAAVVLLLVRFRNVRLLRWEVWCMAIAAFLLYGLAQAVLFRLYLPHRYTYALLPFFCIVVGLSLRPTLEAVAGRSRMLAVAVAPLGALAVAAFALTVFPLGRQLSLHQLGSWLTRWSGTFAAWFAVGLVLAAVVWFRRSGEARAVAAAGAAAVLAGAVLFAAVEIGGGGHSTRTVCGLRPLYRYLATLPKDAVIAGEPHTMNCVPIAARRPVLISTKLYQPWNVAYFRQIRPRMFDLVQALYGPSPDAVVKLRQRYGADYFLVTRPPPEHPWRRMAPFTGEMRRLLATRETPASLRLRAQCMTWQHGKLTMYRLACVAATPS